MVVILCYRKSPLLSAALAQDLIAEAFLGTFGGGRFEAYSAGLQPKELNPLTLPRVMDEVGIEISKQKSFQRNLRSVGYMTE